MSDSIALHARGNPSALAVSEGERFITYGELEAKSSALGHALRTQGIERGHVVGLCARRSISQLVGALGIFRAGAAFLPLDPALPRERTAFQLADASATTLVLGANAGDSSEYGDHRTIRLHDDGTLVVETTEVTVCDFQRRPDDLAYVIYTSGSTGQPKGVEITDGALSNLVRWHQSAFDVTAADRASHISSVGFDAAVWEVWPYLSAGASVHIADDFVAKDPEALRDWLIGNGITLGFAVTPLMERLMDLPWPAKTSLRTMLTGADTLRKYPSSALPFTLVNNYGPTEAAVVATSGVVPAFASAVHHVDRLPSIGKPIANVQIYVLDKNRRLVPGGDDGEIWIAGAGLARGYAGRPDLTNEKFFDSPCDAAPGTRMYRTGDRGRVLPDGDIAFLGRLDEQVKLRGFRIETGEIEAALDAHPAILESAVVVRDVAADDERLVAYVVLRTLGAGTPSTGQIRQFLTTRLPSYMIPSNIVRLPNLPLTSNGKFDRAALRARDSAETFYADDYVAPRTQIEESLARIVAPLLKIDAVSVEDNFFLLGGHSLLGTQLIARIRDAFGVKIGLRYLFESPTIAGLALEVERLTANHLQETGKEVSRAPILKRR